MIDIRADLPSDLHYLRRISFGLVMVLQMGDEGHSIQHRNEHEPGSWRSSYRRRFSPPPPMF